MRTSWVIACLLAMVWTTAPARADGGRYLIVAPDAFEDAIAPLAEWKTRKGMLARVALLSETGYSTFEITQFIADAVENWDPAPEYVLLVGSSGQIPMGSIGYVQTDVPYGNLDGDLFVELHPGRFPADSVTEVETMVAKTLNYERYPTADEGYYRGAALLIHEDNDDDDWLHYFGDAHWESALMAAHGYDDVRILSMNFTDDPTAAFTAAMEEGISYAGYHGQIGGTVGWAGYNVTPDQLDNGPMLPVLVSYTCATLNGGVTWMAAGTPTDPRGGAAFVGQTLSCSQCAMWRSALRRGFWGHIFLDTGAHEVATFGAAAEAGRLRYYDEFHLSDQYHASVVLGDPELNLWSRVPVEIDVSHPPTVPRGEVTVAIEVREQGATRDGIQVCLMSDEGSYGVATTDDSGRVELTLDTSLDTVLYLTATGRDVRPVELEIDVAGEPQAADDDDDDTTGDDDDTTGDDDDSTVDPGDDDTGEDHFTDPYDTEGSANASGTCALPAGRPAAPAALLPLALLAGLALRRRA